MTIVIVVTHLLGAGHLRRAINLAEAIQSTGGDVTVISGGVPVEHFKTEGINFVQLPAIKSDGTNFTHLLQPDGTSANEDYLNKRSELLNQHIKKLSPDVLITELFPFGRRILRSEFISMLELTSTFVKRPLVLASVRDILAPPSTEQKAQKTEDLVFKYYDAVLVHADENIIDLSASWPVSALLVEKLCYTGFVATEAISDTNPVSIDTGRRSGGVLVSAGSGSVGFDIYKSAVQAAALRTDWHWHVLVGGSDADEQVGQLRKMVSSTNIDIEPVRKDFPTLLGKCTCSVSMCGYNTAIDLLQTQTPGVLIPFDEGGETEQTLRAQSLAKRHDYQLLLSKELAAKPLINTIDALNSAKSDTNSGSGTINFDGAKASVDIIAGLLSKKRSLDPS